MVSFFPDGYFAANTLGAEFDATLAPGGFSGSTAHKPAMVSSLFEAGVGGLFKDLSNPDQSLPTPGQLPAHTDRAQGEESHQVFLSAAALQSAMNAYIQKTKREKGNDSVSFSVNREQVGTTRTTKKNMLRSSPLCATVTRSQHITSVKLPHRSVKRCSNSIVDH